MLILQYVITVDYYQTYSSYYLYFCVDTTV